VWGSGPFNVWIGDSTTQSWNGGWWSVFPVLDDAGPSTTLSGIWGSDSSHAWAVGAGGTILHHSWRHRPSVSGSTEAQTTPALRCAHRLIS
jgi:hypothetical protein